jgi:CHAT domain-containing protein
MDEEKADALRKAKLDLLVEFGDQAAPLFWAGFVMVGDGSGIVFIPRQ